MNNRFTLTPNRRLARFLQQQGKARQVHAWNDWLLERWQMDYETINADKPLQCLSDWQSALLWQRIITDLQTNPLFNKTQAVQHARQAWSLVIQWQCDPRTWRGEKTETDTFLHWLDAYEAHCKTHGLLDRALLPLRLLAYWQEHPEAIPSEVCLIGFDEFTPLQTTIIAAWESQGCRVTHEDLATQAQPYPYLAFPDRQTQLTQAALYAKELLASEPILPIGIIIPNIQDHWAKVHEIFASVLGPEQPFNISAGQPLGQCPIIHAALQCLQSEGYRYLLTTPYLAGGISEQSARAQADARFMAYEQDPLPLAFVRRHPDLPEQFGLLFNQALDKVHALEDRRLLPSEWIELLFEVLQIWGWPGERTLSSEAYQAVTHFYRLITELASLDDILGPCSYSRVRTLLSARVHQTMFQPESQDKPIQVLGILEAAGLRFSHLWVMDLGSDTWPAKPSPNPFIPMSVQVKLGFPHASFARELRFAQTMTDRLLRSADTLILSYVMHADEGEATVLPTPIITQAPIPFAQWGQRAHRSVAQALVCVGPHDPLPDPLGLPLENFRVKSGTRLFKDQADCPFRAYARHRLSAKPLEASQMGLSRRVKGTVLHEILEKVWKGEALPKAIDHTLARLQPPLAAIERDLEYQRIYPLLSEWLTHESARPPFEVIALEQAQTVTIEGLTMNLRLDRIDRVEGQVCLIDYKTGEVNPKSWEGLRLDEPQLPLYACVTEPAPQAIAFAQIAKNAMGWKGVGRVAIPGVTQLEPETWDAQLVTWNQAFALLATEYKQGHALVDPKRGKQTCEHCEFHSFCRINDAH